MLNLTFITSSPGSHFSEFATNFTELRTEDQSEISTGFEMYNIPMLLCPKFSSGL